MSEPTVESDEQTGKRPYVGERVEWHADGIGGEAVVLSHSRLHDGEPVIKARDVDRLSELTLMPYEYTVPEYSDRMARHIRDTRRHIRTVQRLLRLAIDALEERCRTHDLSKLEAPEAPTFAQVNDQLSAVTYGSEEYEALLDELGEALEHHYAENRHHPEHFEDGLAGMHLVDLIEMLVDWTAASRRHDDGDIHESIEHNQDPDDGYGYSDQVKQIFHNTAEWLQDNDRN